MMTRAIIRGLIFVALLCTGSTAQDVDIVSAASSSSCSYWLDILPHKGVAAFNSNSSYSVYRNVKSYGAKGDGVTDDTAAIQLAISDGRPAPALGALTFTNYPAVVYFPPGTYLISETILDYYYTQLIGNPNCLPLILATANFDGDFLIDGGPYGWYTSTDIFYRQIRNMVIDTKRVAPGTKITAVHWTTAQATSLQNIVFKLSQSSGSQHVGVRIDDGSGGFMNDLIFYGGLLAMDIGSQQFTMRNLTFYNSTTAIHFNFDWGWTFKGLSINNCTTGVDMSIGGSGAQGVTSVIIIDSTFNNTGVAVLTAHDTSSQPVGAGSLTLENVALNNVPIAVQGASVALLNGTTKTSTISAWNAGHAYTPTGPKNYIQSITANTRPASLTVGGSYYQRSKPQYGTIPSTSFLTARSQGAAGDGVTDDTAALQKAITTAAANSQVLFINAGTYKVSQTLNVPPDSKIVGESYSVIMAAGPYFNYVKDPRPVLKVGTVGQTGQVEMSDMIISTQGQTGGAILIQWNLASPASTPSGLWDVHTRIGGFVGSQQQASACPQTPVNLACRAACMSMHVTSSASGLYMENNWFWVADHDLDATTSGTNDISVLAARGLLVESAVGNIWLYGTAVEHHAMYQYQFYGTKNIFMGQIQTETPYWQPAPNASVPFAKNTTFHDPTFSHNAYIFNGDVSAPNADAWGLRVVNSTGILIYGAGLYSFFRNYIQDCINNTVGEYCQSRIFSVENSTVRLYDLHTVGVHEMITVNGTDIAAWADNAAGFVQDISLFRD